MVVGVECDFFVGDLVRSETSSHVAFCPCDEPPRVAIAAVLAPKGSLGSQVASKLALDRFAEGIIANDRDNKVSTECGSALALLEVAIRKTNDSVYHFGHQLAAGGRCSTSFISLLLEDNLASVARVGLGQVYLIRKGRVYSFFAGPSAYEEHPSIDLLLGSQSQVTIELSSIELSPGDGVLVLQSGRSQPPDGLVQLSEQLGPDWHLRCPLPSLLSAAFRDPQRLPFASLSRIFAW